MSKYIATLQSAIQPLATCSDSFAMTSALIT